LLLLSIALFCRELHFWGTNNGIYLAILLLVWYASRNAHRMQAFLHSRVQVSLFGGAMFTYALTKTFDRGYWKFIAGWPDWQDTMEESLESIAHLLILVLVLASYVDWSRRQRRDLVQLGPFARRLKVWSTLAVSTIVAALTVNHWSGNEPKHGRPRYDGFPVELSSLCNVAPQLGENLFLASSDEEHKLTLWSLDENQRPTVVKHLELNVPLPDGDILHLDDLEDIAWDEHDTYYAVSSHRHLVPSEDAARRNKSHGTECALVSFQLNGTERGIAVCNPRIVTQDLLAKIRDLGVFPSVDWQRSKVFYWRSMVTTWQLNIEGLAYVDGELLLGFKDPIEQGRATILSYALETGELALAARPDLGGHGILSLHYESNTDSLFVLSNDPIKHHFGDSCLWIGKRDPESGNWSFTTQRRVVIERATLTTRRKASGLTIRDGKLAVCFDSETESPIKILALDDVLRR
jgi:hypothetical protein